MHPSEKAGASIGRSGAREAASREESTEAALLVKLGYNAKAEKRLAGLVCNFHPPFRTSFYWIITVTEYFASGFIASN